MIDENRLIEDIKSGKLYGSDFRLDSIEEDILIEGINSQPKVGEWISCSEYFPSEKRIKDETELNVVMNDGEVTSLCWTNTPESYFYDRTTNDVFSPYDEVIAWQPLPDPYEKN